MVNNSQSSVAVGTSPSKKVQQQQNQGNNSNNINNRNHPQTQQQQQQQQNGAGEASNRRRKSSTSTNNATNNNNNAAANETMGMGMDGVGGGGGNFLPGPTSFMDFSLGMLTQCARRYMFIDVTKKALVYLALVAVLSILTKLVPLPSDWYISQKHNVFNRFGTKIGWFWTTLLLCPFMWLTSLLHHESRLKAAYDQMRLLVATCLWYICTNAFVKFENQTGKCHGSVGSARNDCFSDGGKWIPGFDISGHCFLLIYSMLLIAEECTSFRNWPSKPRVSVQHIPSRRDYERFQQSTKFIQWNFVLLFLLHLLWDFQLVVTALYYHDFWQKMIGATIAVVCWAVTYRFWFLVGFPFLPIRRHIKSF